MWIRSLSKLVVLSTSLVFGSITAVSAQQNAALTPELLSSSLLQDFNGNGLIEIVAFGDSITRGEGDFISPSSEVDVTPEASGEAGYAVRIEGYLGVQVANYGSPGESFVFGGLPRLIAYLSRNRPDVLILMEGSNDARLPASAPIYHRAFQTAINVARALGVKILIGTVPPVCCGHQFISGPIDTYNPVLRALAPVNDVALADINKAFTNTCGNVASCRLLNRPEGLHPNILGHDVIGENMVAAILNIDLLAPGGPALLEQALGLAPGSIHTVPDAAPVAKASGTSASKDPLVTDPLSADPFAETVMIP